MDRSAGREGHQEPIGLVVEAATGDTSKGDLIWVPGEGTSTGNVTGRREFARHHCLQANPFDIPNSGLGSPSNATQVVNYISGSVKNDGQALTVTHDGVDDTSAVSPDAKIVTVTPATVADI